MPPPRSKFCFGLIVNPTTCNRCKSVFNLIAVQAQPVNQFEKFLLQPGKTFEAYFLEDTQIPLMISAKASE
mgnify:FL=1